MRRVVFILALLVCIGSQAGITTSPIFPGAYRNVTAYGVPPGGSVDVTTNLQSLLNQGGLWYMPPGSYLFQEITITNNTTILAAGVTWLYNTNHNNTNIFVKCMLNTNISITGPLLIDGQTFTNNSTAYTTYNGAQTVGDNPDQMGYWQFQGLRHGLQVRVDCEGQFSAIETARFSGKGFVPYSADGVTGYRSSKISLQGINCWSNFVGLASDAMVAQHFGPIYILASWWTNEVPGCKPAEYMTYAGVTCRNNVIGAQTSAANCKYVGCNFNENIMGVGGWGSVNGNYDHGVFSGCLFNHNARWTAFWGGSTSGMLWETCHIRGGTSVGNSFYWFGCQGMVVKGCSFDSFAITNTASGGLNRFVDNEYSGLWSAGGFSSDGFLEHHGNASYTVMGDTDAAYVSGTSTARAFTNTFGMPIQCYVASGLLQAVFNSRGSNSIPASVNAASFLVPFGGWTTNGVGSGTLYYYGAP